MLDTAQSSDSSEMISDFRSLILKKYHQLSESASLFTQIVVSLVMCGAIEIWLSEYTEQNFMGTPKMKKAEYLKRQLHVALILTATHCMMFSSRISAKVQKMFLEVSDLEYASDEESITGKKAEWSEHWRSYVEELGSSMLQATVSSTFSPVIVFFVYMFTIGMNTVQGGSYILTEHPSFLTVFDLIVLSILATFLTLMVVSVPLYVLTCFLRLYDFDPDVFVIPLSSVIGHFCYLQSYTCIQMIQYSRLNTVLVVVPIALFYRYWNNCARILSFPLDFLLPASLAIILSIQAALIHSAVYLKYPKIEIVFTLTGVLICMHAASIGSKFVLDCTRRIPYSVPKTKLFGEEREFKKVILSVIALPVIIPLLSLHSKLVERTLPMLTIFLSMGFSFGWLLLNLLLARWVNHYARHRYGKQFNTSCPTIAFLELVQHLVQTTVYFYVIGYFEDYFNKTDLAVYSFSKLEERNETLHSYM